MRHNGPILLLDDNAQVVEALRHSLRPCFHEIIIETYPLKALELIESRTIEVIVSDEKMPRINGSQLLSRICKTSPTTVGIILTGQATIDDAIVAVNEGNVFRYLTKPCDTEILVKYIEQAFDEHRRRKFLADTEEYINYQVDKKTITNKKVDSDCSTEAKPKPANRKSLVGFGEVDEISKREGEVLDLLCAGLRVADISRDLCISKDTVRSHLKSLFKKLGVHSQSQLQSKVKQ